MFTEDWSYHTFYMIPCGRSLIWLLEGNQITIARAVFITVDQQSQFNDFYLFTVML